MLVMPCPSSVWRRRCGVLARQAGLATLLAFAAAAARAQEPPCSPALARIVALPEAGANVVQVRRAGKAWIAAERDGVLCSGDSVRVLQYGQATLRLSNETTIRLDQGTTLTLAPPDTRRATLLEQLSGRLHVMTRTPRAFSIKTPFVNANVQGTEFAVLLTDSSATVAVVEGKVELENDAGSTLLGSGEQATATQGAAPKRDLVVRPADAVAWTLYFPAVFDHRLAGASAEAGLQPSLTLYRAGRVADALAAIGPPPAGPAGATWLSYRAGLLLQLGRLDEAKPAIEQALQRQPGHSDAHALLAVVAVVENDKQLALELAQQAVHEDPKSPAALIALSYAEQARFQLEPALARVLDALGLAPSSALAHARRAELELSLGRLDAALAAANEAARLDPTLAKTQSVLGFANLARIDVPAARAAFDRAIALDTNDPLPRLGLGLAKIRQGELERGRADIEIAVALDPGNSLLRSYLGKAYYEESRGQKAAVQFDLAVERDPLDPTPHLYGALMAQAQNRPVQALEELNRSIALNDNRAVYRSQLMQDEDAATRRSSQARIYLDLGFEQLAVVEAVKSLAADSANSAAHAFLADYYLSSPRHDLARDSELLQAQLLRPLGSAPAQPRLASAGLTAIDQSQFITLGANEYGRLLTRQGVYGALDFAAGSQRSYASSAAVSGLGSSSAFSLGHSVLGTEGYRVNNDQKLAASNGWFQFDYSPQTSVQAELRRVHKQIGDTSISFFDAENFDSTLRDELTSTSLRLGLRHAFQPGSVLLASYVYRRQQEDFLIPSAGFGLLGKENVSTLELRHILQARDYSLTHGVGITRGRQSDTQDIAPFGPMTTESKLRHLNLYSYWTGHVAKALDLTLGLTADAYDDGNVKRNQLNPKFGLLWSPSGATTVRVAAVRALKRRVVSGQTIEPTGVVGFNQFFSGVNDLNGTDSRLLGAAVSHRLNNQIAVGTEWSGRVVNYRAQQFGTTESTKFRETLANAYLYWTPTRSTALNFGITFEALKSPDAAITPNLLLDSRSLVVPLELRHFRDSGWLGSLKLTGVRQTGSFLNFGSFTFEQGKDQATLLDLTLGYRFAGGKGLILFELKNAMDEIFRLQEINPQSSQFARRRSALIRGSLNF